MSSLSQTFPALHPFPRDIFNSYEDFPILGFVSRIVHCSCMQHNEPVAGAGSQETAGNGR